MTTPWDAGSGWRPTATTKVVGVVGDPVGHSLSPVLHNAAFSSLRLDWVSVAYPVAAGCLGDALGIAGLSVTMPHKDDAARLVDRLSPAAERLSAVNCIVRDGADLVGENTDGEGFVAALHRGTGFDPHGARCVVIGAGGAARSIVAALAAAGASDIAVINRTESRAAAAAGLAGGSGHVGVPGDAEGAALVVNATPVGMVGTGAATAVSAVDPTRLGAGQVVADLVYHPLITPWLEAASHAGATPLGGLGMLVHQAALQLQRWTGCDAPLPAMWDAATGAVAMWDAATGAVATASSE